MPMWCITFRKANSSPKRVKRETHEEDRYMNLTDTLWRVMFRSIRRRPFQSVLFVAGVALGVAMIVAIDLANGSAARSFSLFTESIAGRSTHQITGGPTGLPDDLYA